MSEGLRQRDVELVEPAAAAADDDAHPVMMEETHRFDLVGFLPKLTIVEVVKEYGGNFVDNLVGDFGAGLVVAVVLIPQGMAYASLAGVPPIYGLYSSIFCLVVYPFFGTSPQLAVGPTALMSLLSAAAVSTIADPDTEPDKFLRLTNILTLLTGVVQLLLGLLHAGYVVNFLSHPVLKGFTSASAIIIGSSQLAKVFGVSIERQHYVYMTWVEVIREIADGNTNWVTFALACENLALFYILRYLKRWVKSWPSVKARKWAGQLVAAIPNALVVVVVNLLLSNGLDLPGKHGVKVVTDIPSGMEAPRNVFAFAEFSEHIGALFASAIVMGLIGFMESSSVGKAMALRFNATIDSSQELVGLGLMQVVGAFFRSIPTTGGFSRTSINADAGAKTTLAGVVSGVMLLFVVLFMTSLFEGLPDATLATLIIFAVLKLIELETPRGLWKVDKADFFVYVMAFILTLALGIENGVLIAVGISLIRIIQQSAMPHVAVMGKLRGSSTWRNLRRYPKEAQETPGLRVVRFDAPLYFANADFFRDLIMDLMLPRPKSQPTSRVATPRGILVDCAAVVSVDSSALHMLETLPKELQKQAQTLKKQRLESLFRRLATAVGSKSEASKRIAALKAETAGQVGEEPNQTLLLGHSQAVIHLPGGDRPRWGDRALPDTDDDVQNGSAGVLVARYCDVDAQPAKAPMLFFTSMRGPVRDMVAKNDAYLKAEEAKHAAIVKGWRTCEWPDPPAAARAGAAAGEEGATATSATVGDDDLESGDPNKAARARVWAAQEPDKIEEEEPGAIGRVPGPQPDEDDEVIQPGQYVRLAAKIKPQQVMTMVLQYKDVGEAAGFVADMWDEVDRLATDEEAGLGTPAEEAASDGEDAAGDGEDAAEASSVPPAAAAPAAAAPAPEGSVASGSDGKEDN